MSTIDSEPDSALIYKKNRPEVGDPTTKHLYLHKIYNSEYFGKTQQTTDTRH